MNFPDRVQPSEGWFIKTAYNYYRHAESYGTVHLDYMQKKGIGTGVDHTYYDRGSSGKGEISVYRLQNPADDSITWEGSWQQSLQLNPELRLEMGTEYLLQPAAGSAEAQWELEPGIKLSKRGQGNRTPSSLPIGAAKMENPQQKPNLTGHTGAV